jgi:hypothetical protein
MAELIALVATKLQLAFFISATISTTCGGVHAEQGC